MLLKALDGVSYVFHLAAYMDLMPTFSEFFDVNVTSTALLYELIVKNSLPVKKIVVASSQFVYGDGLWRCEEHGEFSTSIRNEVQLNSHVWNYLCPLCQKEASYVTHKETYQNPQNQYAISKYTQELIALRLGKLYKIPSVAMRYSIVHGPRQSLKNFYSGALRTFAMKISSGAIIATFEDNMSLRDYVSIYDVAEANSLVLENEKTDYEVYNVGGGRPISVTELANIVGSNFAMKPHFAKKIEYRLGDTRHSISDITKLQALGWKPINSEESTVSEYINWFKTKLVDPDALKENEKSMRAAGVVKEAK